MMSIAPKPSNETARLEKLASYGILDTGPEEAFDRITRLAARMFRAPTALISLIDENREWIKSRHGFDLEEVPRSEAFCAHTILRDDVMVVADASKDPRFSGSRLVRGKPHVRFYAGAPLIAPDGFNIGSLCVIDMRPREMSPEDCEALRDMACVVVQAFEWRRIASIDPVTELPNRRFFEDSLSRERKRAQRNGRSITVVIIALDRLASRKNSGPRSASRFCGGSRSSCESSFAIPISWCVTGPMNSPSCSPTRMMRGHGLSPSICATNLNSRPS